MKCIMMILGFLVIIFIFYIEFYWGNPYFRNFPNNGFEEVRPILSFIRYFIYPILCIVFLLFVYFFVKNKL